MSFIKKLPLIILLVLFSCALYNVLTEKSGLNTLNSKSDNDKSSKIYFPTADEIHLMAKLIADEFNSLVSEKKTMMTWSDLGIQQSLSANDLIYLYNQNEVATDEKIKDKIIEIHGRIFEIRKDFKNDPVITLSGNNIFEYVNAYMGDSDMNFLTRLRSGRKVSLICRVSGRVLRSPFLEECKRSSSSLNQLDHRLNQFLSGKAKTDKLIARSLLFAQVISARLPSNSECKNSVSPKCSTEIEKILQEPKAISALKELDIHFHDIGLTESLLMVAQ